MPTPEVVNAAEPFAAEIKAAAVVAGVTLLKFENNRTNLGVTAELALAIAMTNRGWCFIGERK